VRIDDVIEQVRCNRQKDSSFIPLPVCANPDPAAAPLAPLASASG
jgi:hypothetical protein